MAKQMNGKDWGIYNILCKYVVYIILIIYNIYICIHRFVSIHSTCLTSSNIQDFATVLKQEVNSGIVKSISEHLMSMGVDAHIAVWAATSSEGSTREQRINSALNLVYS